MSVLDEIQARADAATEGPWAWAKGDEACAVEVPEGRDGLYGPLTWDDHNGEVFQESDAQFIAHAREDVPKLVAALRAVEVLTEQWRYKGEFGWGAWQEGHGPSPEGAAYDDASATIRGAISGVLDG